ncbi:MAG: hypothetical protein ACP5OJ_02180 [Methanothermobacter sp.]
MDKWYSNRRTLTGVLLIVLGFLIYELEFLHDPATMLFYPLLLGSSEGKTVLFLFLMGSLLILNSIISSGKITTKFIDWNIWDGKRYLKYTIIILLITYLLAICIEIWLRLYFGVSLFTVFVSLDPNVTTTSIIHTHVYKSVLGSILSNLGQVLPSNIHTGNSLFKYIPSIAYLILLTLPLAYITSLLSMDNRSGFYKTIIAFAASLSLIGMFDGGLFSNPAIIGLAGLIGVYFIDGHFELRKLIKPGIIIALIIFMGLFIEIAGSNPDYHQITLINQTEPVNWNGYQVLTGENNTIKIYDTQNDRQNLLNLFGSLKGKTDAFFITWNFYSYI